MYKTVHFNSLIKKHTSKLVHALILIYTI